MQPNCGGRVPPGLLLHARPAAAAVVAPAAAPAAASAAAQAHPAQWRWLGATGAAAAALTRRSRRRAPAARAAGGRVVDPAAATVDAWIESQLAKQGEGEFPALAQRGQAALKEMAHPSRRQEAFKYTDLKALFVEPKASAAPAKEALRAAVLELLEEEPKDFRLVFVDGVLEPELSTGVGEGKDVFVGGGAALRSQGAAVQERLGELLSGLPEVDMFAVPFERDELGCKVLAAINQSVFQDAACIHCPGSKTGPADAEATTVEVVFVTTGASAAASAPRLLIDVGTNRRVRVFESHLSSGPSDESVSNGLCRVVLADGAIMEHEFIQAKADGARLVESLTAEVAENARYELRIVQSGTRVGRINAAIGLEGTSSSCDVFATMLGGGKQQLDLHSLIHHSVPGCESRQQHKNIVGETAECIFKGSIKVDKAAQQTKSEQICRTLLLTKKAKVKAMPSLAIQADDVTCSHGAAVTELDKDQVFYMKSRGLDPASAKKLMLVAFPQDLLGDLKDSAPKAYQRIVDKLVKLAELSDDI